MKHDLLTVVMDLYYRITPTEIRVQVVETDWHINRRYGRQKSCCIHEKHCKPPLRDAFFPRFSSCKIITRSIKKESRLPKMMLRSLLDSGFSGPNGGLCYV